MLGVRRFCSVGGYGDRATLVIRADFMAMFHVKHKMRSPAGPSRVTVQWVLGNADGQTSGWATARICVSRETSACCRSQPVGRLDLRGVDWDRGEAIAACAALSIHARLPLHAGTMLHVKPRRVRAEARSVSRETRQVESVKIHGARKERIPVRQEPFSWKGGLVLRGPGTLIDLRIGPGEAEWGRLWSRECRAWGKGVGHRIVGYDRRTL